MTQLYNSAFQYASMGQLLIDPISDSIALANQRACQILEMEQQQIHSTKVSTLFKNCFAKLLVFTDEVITNGNAWQDGLHVVTGQDKPLRIEITACTLDIENKQFLSFSFQDAQKLQQKRDQNDAQRHYLSGLGQWNRISKVFQEFERENQLILTAAGEGIYGIDTEGRTTFVNPAAEAMLGWTAEELAHKKIHRLIHHSHSDCSNYPEECCPIYASFSDGQVRKVDDEVFWTKNGDAIDVEYTSTPIYDNGFLVGAVVIFRDITQKKSDQRRLVSALKEVERLKQRLEMENAYLQEEINSNFNHHKIIGQGPAIQNILQKIDLAAPTDITVLITGESGTGKELIARAIHESSQRKRRSLIRVNCAAIPSDLFESEFFGHVKGAFTGATDNRPGRFELADGGTLFLDEVAEIPLNLQAKLLRVLQEQQFERVGEAKTRAVDVRIIAATNKDLALLVEQGKFREDLYFRLNVFPVHSCPLRQRKEDIPLLAQHFLKRASTKANKSDLKIPLSQIEKLKRYHWPGNIRELENVIERQVILCQDDVLHFNDLPTHNKPIKHNNVIEIQGTPLTDTDLKAQQRKNMIIALKQCSGKVFGPGGAAELLNIAPTTLASRIKRHNIDISLFKDLKQH